jgi:hypothetical protein
MPFISFSSSPRSWSHLWAQVVSQFHTFLLSSVAFFQYQRVGVLGRLLALVLPHLSKVWFLVPQQLIRVVSIHKALITSAPLVIQHWLRPHRTMGLPFLQSITFCSALGDPRILPLSAGTWSRFFKTWIQYEFLSFYLHPKAQFSGRSLGSSPRTQQYLRVTLQPQLSCNRGSPNHHLLEAFVSPKLTGCNW